jgi:hypothetical protein
VHRGQQEFKAKPGLRVRLEKWALRAQLEVRELPEALAQPAQLVRVARLAKPDRWDLKDQRVSPDQQVQRAQLGQQGQREKQDLQGQRVRPDRWGHLELFLPRPLWFTTLNQNQLA